MSKFCTNCGTKLPQQSSLMPQAEVSAAKPVQTALAPKKKKTWLIVLIAVLAGVSLMAAGIFAAVRLLDLDGMDIRLDRYFSHSTHRQEEPEEREERREEDERPDRVETPEPVEETEAPEPAEETEPPQTEPAVLTTADRLSDAALEPLIGKALELRAVADAKWDHKTEIPGDCEYKGYIYMEEPGNSDNNRLYLVFVVDGLIKDHPITFVYWVYFDGLSFDEQDTLSYETVATSRDDGYTVKTAFGSFYSYYGLDDYDLFMEKIIGSQTEYEVVKDSLSKFGMRHPVSETFQ